MRWGAWPEARAQPRLPGQPPGPQPGSYSHQHLSHKGPGTGLGLHWHPPQHAVAHHGRKPAFHSHLLNGSRQPSGCCEDQSS